VAEILIKHWCLYNKMFYLLWRWEEKNVTGTPKVFKKEQ